MVCNRCSHTFRWNDDRMGTSIRTDVIVNNGVDVIEHAGGSSAAVVEAGPAPAHAMLGRRVQAHAGLIASTAVQRTHNAVSSRKQLLL